MLVAKSLTGEELARQLISAISTELGITSNLVVGAIHDRASVNNVAIQTVAVVYPRIFDIGCFAHTLVST